jgi:hypothetical protein
VAAVRSEAIDWLANIPPSLRYAVSHSFSQSQCQFLTWFFVLGTPFIGFCTPYRTCSISFHPIIPQDHLHPAGPAVRNACALTPCSASAHAQGSAGDTHCLRDGDEADEDERRQAAAQAGGGN